MISVLFCPPLEALNNGVLHRLICYVYPQNSENISMCETIFTYSSNEYANVEISFLNEI